jgi:hypothetical protein
MFSIKYQINTHHLAIKLLEQILLYEQSEHPYKNIQIKYLGNIPGRGDLVVIGTA